MSEFETVSVEQFQAVDGMELFESAMRQLPKIVDTANEWLGERPLLLMRKQDEPFSRQELRLRFLEMATDELVEWHMALAERSEDEAKLELMDVLFFLSLNPIVTDWDTEMFRLLVDKDVFGDNSVSEKTPELDVSSKIRHLRKKIEVMGPEELLFSQRIEANQYMMEAMASIFRYFKANDWDLLETLDQVTKKNYKYVATFFDGYSPFKDFYQSVSCTRLVMAASAAHGVDYMEQFLLQSGAYYVSYLHPPIEIAHTGIRALLAFILYKELELNGGASTRLVNEAMRMLSLGDFRRDAGDWMGFSFS